MTNPSHMAPAPNGQPDASRPRRSHRWIWFFVVVVGLTVAAVAILWIYNLKQQLTPEKLAAAWKQWKEKGPANYDMKYQVKYNEEENTVTYTVRVRHGEVEYAEPDDRPLEKKQGYYGMPALFSFIKRFLEMDEPGLMIRLEESGRTVIKRLPVVDAKPRSPRTFTVATFDADDGHLIHYVRRVMGTTERVEITVDFEKKRPQ
jgi:hypothetical protein